MSHRRVLSIIKRDEWVKWRLSTLDQLKYYFDKEDDDNKCISLEHVGEVIFDFGSNQNHIKKLLKISTPISIHKEVNEFLGNDLVQLDERALQFTIDIMSKEVSEMYKQFYDKPEKGRTIFFNRMNEWAGVNNGNNSGVNSNNPDSFPYNMDKENWYIVNSPDFEYKIFDVVRTLKTFNSSYQVLILKKVGTK